MYSVSASILAGGLSRRLGFDKILLSNEICDGKNYRPLLILVLEMLTNIFDEVLITVADYENFCRNIYSAEIWQEWTPQEIKHIENIENAVYISETSPRFFASSQNDLQLRNSPQIWQWSWKIFSQPVLVLEDTLVSTQANTRAAIFGLHAALSYTKCDSLLALALDMPFLSYKVLQYLKECADIENIVMPVIGDYSQPLLSVYPKKVLTSLEHKIYEGKFSLNKFILESSHKKLFAKDTPYLNEFNQARININTPDEFNMLRNKKNPQ